MFDKEEINAELIATALFAIISGLYIESKYGMAKVYDLLLVWAFPASVMVFLTLLVAKIIERWHKRRVKSWKYVDFTNR